MQAKAYGPGISGALFGGGWWFWVDACAASHTQVPFVQYLPGIVATLALIMINAIRRYIPPASQSCLLDKSHVNIPNSA